MAVGERNRNALKGVLVSLNGHVNGEQNDAKIQPKAPVFEIPDIVFDPFAEQLVVPDLSPETMYLRPPC